MRAAARRSHASTATSLYHADASGVLENATSGRPRMTFGFVEACDETGLGAAPCGRGALTVCGRLLLGGAMPTVFSACAAQCSAGSTSIRSTEKTEAGVITRNTLTVPANAKCPS